MKYKNGDRVVSVEVLVHENGIFDVGTEFKVLSTLGEYTIVVTSAEGIDLACHESCVKLKKEDFTNVNYAQMVDALAKPGAAIIAELSDVKAHQIHMAIGISGEAGELLDAVKKSAIYNKNLDVVNVVEELGDLEFYMEGLRQSIGITREQCLNANKEKLSQRYHKLTYSNEQAQKRADKQDG